MFKNPAFLVMHNCWLTSWLMATPIFIPISGSIYFYGCGNTTVLQSIKFICYILVARFVWLLLSLKFCFYIITIFLKNHVVCKSNGIVCMTQKFQVIYYSTLIGKYFNVDTDICKCLFLRVHFVKLVRMY